MNELLLITFSPLVAGVLAWLVRIRGVRESLGILGAIVPLAFLIKLYPSLDHPIRATISLGGFELGFSMSHLNWVFSMIAAVVGLSAVFGMASTAKDSYEWLFSLMSLTGALGIFMAQDLVTFFIFWEVMTFSSFMMVLKFNRAASLKYLILSIIGAYSMLVAIGIIYAKTGTFTFADISAFFRKEAMLAMLGGKSTFSRFDMALIYLLFLMAFGVKAGMFPLHVWAPDAYSETDQSYTAIFSGVLSKTGVYGFILLYVLMYGKLLIDLGQFKGTPLFGYIIAFLGGLTIIIGGVLAALQEDIRKLFAYSSISQVGYILVGLGIGTSLGIEAAIYHAISHALFKGLFFLVVATIIYRTGKLSSKTLEA